MIALACDHTGIELKKEMMKLLGGKGKNGKRRRRMPPFNPAMLKNMPPM